MWLEQGANNPYWDAQHNAAAEAGRRLGFTFKAVSGNNNPQDQASVMNQFVDQGVDVIMLNAIDPKAMDTGAPLREAEGRQGPEHVRGRDKATASVTFDEIRRGGWREVAVEAPEEAVRVAKGKVAVLRGILGQPASDLRAKGFVDYMKKNGVERRLADQPTGWAGRQGIGRDAGLARQVSGPRPRVRALGTPSRCRRRP